MTSEYDVVDLFAGPGGWDQGIRQAAPDLKTLGIDTEPTACDTAVRAGHYRQMLDISTLNPYDFDYPLGHVGSPPCQGFSTAGLQNGHSDIGELIYVASTAVNSVDLDICIKALQHKMKDPRSTLVLEPLRWALAHQPEWIAWEQVPSVLPIWEACAETLRRYGYNVVTGALQAEQYGVPQSRRRAVLMAHKTRTIELPKPTHSRYHTTAPARRDAGVDVFVSTDDVLGLGMHFAGAGAAAKKTAGQLPRAPHLPAHTVTGVGSAAWVYVDGGGDVHLIRSANPAELGVLQTFPANYPWSGDAGQQHQQVGNAIPPLLAQRIIETLI